MPLFSHRRTSGVLLHVTSLPSGFGIGDLGPESYRFADLLAKNNQRFWSILPLSPTRQKDGNSPYQTSSVYAGNPLLISPEKLIQDGYLPKNFQIKPVESTSRVDFQAVCRLKGGLLNQATKLYDDGFEDYCSQNAAWLESYALYAALHETSGLSWNQWPSSVRRRDSQAINRKKEALKGLIDQVMFLQYLFFSQWNELKQYCHKRDISIVGDMPFYVAYDSADAWVNPELFLLSKAGQPKFVGGVPPDYFSATGQLWGNPVYDWKQMEQNQFEWWMARIRHNLKLYDSLRLDHFRGFVAYWQIPAHAKTAQGGCWVTTPSNAFFKQLKQEFPSLPLIAEDLGYIDAPVREAIARLKIPGMRVLLFGFDGSEGNPHLVRNHTECSVVYTGTHDTNTVRGWFTEEASAKEKRTVYKSVGKKVTAHEVSCELVKMALSSRSKLSIVPLQDILGLGSNARMNSPGQAQNNWSWRVTPKQLSSQRLALFGELTAQYR